MERWSASRRCRCASCSASSCHGALRFQGEPESQAGAEIAKAASKPPLRMSPRRTWRPSVTPQLRTSARRLAMLHAGTIRTSFEFAQSESRRSPRVSAGRHPAPGESRPCACLRDELADPASQPGRDIVPALAVASEGPASAGRPGQRAGRSGSNLAFTHPFHHFGLRLRSFLVLALVSLVPFVFKIFAHKSSPSI